MMVEGARYSVLLFRFCPVCPPVTHNHISLSPPYLHRSITHQRKQLRYAKTLIRDSRNCILVSKGDVSLQSLTEGVLAGVAV